MLLRWRLGECPVVVLLLLPVLSLSSTAEIGDHNGAASWSCCHGGRREMEQHRPRYGKLVTVERNFS
jgi:hypothetical protein